jgi:hypothetical protein
MFLLFKIILFPVVVISLLTFRHYQKQIPTGNNEVQLKL